MGIWNGIPFLEPEEFASKYERSNKCLSVDSMCGTYSVGITWVKHLEMNVRNSAKITANKLK